MGPAATQESGLPRSLFEVARHGALAPRLFRRPLVALIPVGSALAGLVAGLSVAAAVLTLAGRSILDLAPSYAQLLLVLGPLAGLLPMAALTLAAGRHRGAAESLPVSFIIWALCVATVAYWFGVRPFWP